MMRYIAARVVVICCASRLLNKFTQNWDGRTELNFYVNANASTVSHTLNLPSVVRNETKDNLRLPYVNMR